jgi:hypothetical protein
MIRIALAAALVAIVIVNATIGPASELGATVERPRGLKGDRLPVLAPNTSCVDVVWPNQQGECVRVRVRELTPPARAVRIVTPGRTAIVV